MKAQMVVVMVMVILWVWPRYVSKLIRAETATIMRQEVELLGL